MNSIKFNIKRILAGLFLIGILITPQAQVGAYYATSGGETLSSGNSNGNTNSYYNNNYNNSNYIYPFSVTTYSANNVGENLANLRGYINYGGGYNVDCWFEWGTGGYVNNYSARTSYGSGSTSCSYTLSGLSPNTTYYYRAVAQTPQGIVYGDVLNFRTSGPYVSNTNTSVVNTSTSNAPRVVTDSAKNVLYTTADINGIALIGSGAITNAWFEWGATPALGNSTNKTNIGSDPSVNFRTSISDLKDGSTYYYRAVIENSYGTARGDILSFKTKQYSSDTEVIVNNKRVSDTPSSTAKKDDSADKTKDVKEDENADADVSKSDEKSGMVASIIFGSDGFLPDSLLGWMILFASILIIICCIRRIFGLDKDKNTEVKK